MDGAAKVLSQFLANRIGEPEGNAAVENNLPRFEIAQNGAGSRPVSFTQNEEIQIHASGRLNLRRAASSQAHAGKGIACQARFLPAVRQGAVGLFQTQIQARRFKNMVFLLQRVAVISYVEVPLPAYKLQELSTP